MPAIQKIDGDTGFVGVVSRASADQLPAGVASSARNMRFTDGKARTRKGVAPIPHMSKTLVGDPKLYEDYKRRGEGVFKDPNGQRFEIFVSEGRVFYSRVGMVPQQVPVMPNTYTSTTNPYTGVVDGGGPYTYTYHIYINNDVVFVQSFDKVLMFRGDIKRPMVMADIDTGFTFLVDDYDPTSAYSNGDEVYWGTSHAGLDIYASGAGQIQSYIGTDVGEIQYKIYGIENPTFYTAHSLVAFGRNDDADFNFSVGEEVTMSSTGKDGWEPRRVEVVATGYPVQIDYLTAGAIVDPTTGGTGATDIYLEAEMASAIPAGSILYFKDDEGGSAISGGFELQDPVLVGDTMLRGWVRSGSVASRGFGWVDEPNCFAYRHDGLPEQNGVVTQDTLYSATTIALTECMNFDTTYQATASNYTVTDISAGGVITIPATHTIVNGDIVTLSGFGAGHDGNWTITTPVTSTTAVLTAYGAGGIAATGTATVEPPKVGESPTSRPEKWTEIGTVFPPCSIATSMQNRVIGASTFRADTTDNAKRDYVIASDLLDPIHTFYSQEFRINEGSDDEIVELVPYSGNQLIVFKSTSVHVVTSFHTDLSSVRRDTLIPNYGIAGPRAAALAGSDILFWSGSRGLVSLKQNEEGKLVGVDIPMTADIQDIADKIDYTNTHKIRVRYHYNRLYVAVPLSSGDGDNNAVLVYDYTNQRWSGYDDGAAIEVQEWFEFWRDDEWRLGFRSVDGGAYEYEASFAEDRVLDDTATNGEEVIEIESELVTREYHGKELPFTIRRIDLELKTYDPSYSVEIVPSGAFEEISVASGETKDRSKYTRPFDSADYDVSNDNDDFDTPYREDYSIESGAAGTYVSSVGVVADQMQEESVSFKPKPREGSGTSVKITNTKGAISVERVVAHGTLRENRYPSRS